MKSIIVDSDALVALSKIDDLHHGAATGIQENLSKRDITLCTSNYVFAETVTVISQRVGFRAAVSFINVMKSDKSAFIIIWINEEIEKLAIEIFKTQSSKNVSFVDCTNMALMQKEKIDAIFSFDKVYKKNRYKMMEDYI